MFEAMPSAPTPLPPPAGLIARMRRRIGNPMDWTPLARVLLLEGLLLPFVILTAVLFHLAAAGGFGDYFRPELTRYVAFFLDAAAVGNFLTLVLGFPFRKRTQEAPILTLILVVVYSWGLLFVYWSVGFYDTVGLFFLICGLIIAMPLVDLKIVGVAVWSVLLLLPLIFIGEVLKWIPIAPALTKPAGFSDPQAELIAKAVRISAAWPITCMLWLFVSRFFRRWREREEQFRELSTLDPLTGILNRRSFFSIYERECARAKRVGSSVSLLMFDIDHFKKVNDTHGHRVGDEVLVEIARTLGEEIRTEVDSLGRFGGEEFILLLPETEKASAVLAAERLLEAVRRLEFGADGRKFGVTASIGVASAAGDADPEVLLESADQNLYRAKNAGRDQVEAG